MEQANFLPHCDGQAVDLRELSPLSLAFVGDGVLELLVRRRLVAHTKLHPGALNAVKVKYVSAHAQYWEEKLLEPMLTEDEISWFKRGRNANKATVSKHATAAEYRASTGFECLLGWLYLSGQMDRILQLFDVLWEKFDPKDPKACVPQPAPEAETEN